MFAVSNENDYLLLVGGYVRLNFSSTENYEYIPDDVSLLCLSFYNDVQFFSYSLQAVLNIKQDDTKLFHVDHIPIQGQEISIFIQFDPKMNEYDVFLYFVDGIPGDVTQMDTYFEIYCYKLGIGCKNGVRYPSKALATQQHIYCFSIPYLSVEKLKNKDKMEKLGLSVRFEILNIIRDNKLLIVENEIPYKLRSNLKFEWMIDKDLLQRFKNAQENQEFYSQNFGADSMNTKQYGFCLMFIPNRCSYSENGTKLILRNLCLPTRISCIYCRVKLEDGIKNKTWENARFGVDSSSAPTLLNSFKALDKLSMLRVEIEVRNIYDNNKQMVQ